MTKHGSFTQLQYVVKVGRQAVCSCSTLEEAFEKAIPMSWIKNRSRVRIIDTELKVNAYVS